MHNTAFALFVIFASARLMAEVFERMRQPGIAGEILAGIMIGPHVLNWIQPNEASNILGELGVMFLLYRVGLEVRSAELIALAREAGGIALAGVVLPFFMGWGISAWWGLPNVESVFIGAAMVATSVGITAQVLNAGGWLEERSAKLILAAAVIDDVLGLLVLVGVSSMARGSFNYVELAVTAGLAIGFVVLFATIGGPAIKRIVPKARHNLYLEDSEFAIGLILMLGLAMLAVNAGVAAIIGAFLAGMALSDTVEKRVHDLTEGVTQFLVPFFLVGIGLKLDLSVFRSLGAIAFAALIIVAAVVSKFAGCSLAAAGSGRKEAIRVGVGMIPRGEVGMVVAQIGLGFGVMAQNVYGTIVFMSVATTLIAPALLRRVYRDATPSLIGLKSPMRIG